MESFSELSIKEQIKKAIEEMNYITPTPIQKKAIPVGLENRDIIGQAQTGTGKTAAYTIPILNKTKIDNYVIQTLILCPTRELAIQVTQEIRKMCKYLEEIRVVPVYGGQSYDIQITALKRKPQIIVGTPGRIIDLMNRSLLKFENVDTVVLDEADEMLKMGFKEDLETILNSTPANRQTMMFSATMPDPIIEIADNYLKEYEFIRIENKTITVDKIDQYYYLCKNEEKINLLIRLLDFYNVTSAIVFCNTKKFVDELVVLLQNNGYVTEGIHGDLKQGQRDRVMSSFRSSSVRILVATDVAARGLDIDDVEAVFNYDIPLEEELYVHRIGRTGRAGKSGKAFTFVNKRQEYRIPQIEKYINSKINKGKIPSVDEIRYVKTLEIYQKIKGKVQNGEKLYDFNQTTKQLLNDGFSYEQIINAMLNMISQDSLKEYKDIEEITSSAVKTKDKRARESRKTEKPRDKREKVTEKKDMEVREERRNRKSEKKVLLYMNIGSRQEIKVGDIIDFFRENFRIRKNDIGTIEITKKATYAEVYENDAKKMLSSGNQATFRNHDISLEIIK